MILLTDTGSLRGTVVLPASKSICNRVLLMAALTPGGVALSNLSDCDDTRAMLRALGVSAGVADVGAAGTAMRFSAAYFAATPGRRLLTGTPRMLSRPIRPLVEALRSLGASVDYAGADGFPPLDISGHTLTGGEVTMDATVSSQYVSALLMIAPVMPKGLRLTLSGDIVSRPYIDLTLGLMRCFGASAQWLDSNTLHVAPLGYSRTEPFVVESDWSAASYWYELVALTPDAGARIALPRLSSDSLQGDSRVSRFFEPLGVVTEFTTDGVVLTKSQAEPAPTCLRFDLTEQPDLAQTLVVACAMRGVPFRFSGLQSLRIKETDRISALQTELAKFGIRVQNQGDSVLTWDGTVDKVPHGETIVVDTYDDHRMAMAFAPAALAGRQVAINNPEVVSKSYPHFWDDLRPYVNQKHV